LVTDTHSTALKKEEEEEEEGRLTRKKNRGRKYSDFLVI
jgi:hypothetical protein